MRKLGIGVFARHGVWSTLPRCLWRYNKPDRYGDVRVSTLRLTQLILLLALGGSLLHCDRAVLPFDPDERVEVPDLSKIFPPGSEQTSSGPPADLAALPDPAGSQGQRGSADAPDPSIRGEVRLAEGQTAASGAILFVIARTGSGGPPVAVKRFPNPTFPLTFQVGPADRMLENVPFRGPFQLSARLDGDGNATTRQAGDLAGEAAGSIAPGARGVLLVLSPSDDG